MRPRRHSLVLGLVCTALAAGCTTVSQGEPAPATTGTAETAQTTESQPSETDPGGDLPTDGAPAVPDPLDTTAFQQNPCRSLTAAQSTELEVTTDGKPVAEALGNSCMWQNPRSTGVAILSFLDKDPRGLSAEYHADKEGKWAYFEELSPIEGFPAVARDLSDERGTGNCSVVVGVSDQISFALYLQQSHEKIGQVDPCSKAAEVAGMALQTMKGA
jgi:hypothetical protein